MAYCADMLDYYAGLVVDGSTKEQRAPPPRRRRPARYDAIDATACTHRDATYPAGVAALVTPWNYPLLRRSSRSRRPSPRAAPSCSSRAPSRR